jgi:hypothetical protein
VADEKPSGEDDRGSLMRQWLIHFSEQRPFVPFIIRLEGGFELRAMSFENIDIARGALAARVFRDEDKFDVFQIDRIVSLRTL